MNGHRIMFEGYDECLPSDEYELRFLYSEDIIDKQFDEYHFKWFFSVLQDAKL